MSPRKGSFGMGEAASILPASILGQHPSYVLLGMGEAESDSSHCSPCMRSHRPTLMLRGTWKPSLA